MVENIPCPIWGTSARHYIGSIRGGVHVNSLRAGGEFFVDRRSQKTIAKLDDRAKARLTTWLIEQRRLGNELPGIGWLHLENPMNPESVLTQRPDLTVHARADELLKYFQNKTSYIGEGYGFTASNPPLEMFAYTESVEEDELQYLLNYLFEQGWLKLNAHETQTQNMNVTIPVKGYSRLAELENVKKATSQAFVAMWFHEDLVPAWNEGIEPAIKDAGYTAVRVDKQEHIEKIDDRIIAEIRRSRFVVADFTHGKGGARGGVYYEAGFAHGLKIPVIFTCRKNAIKRIHFDTRQYNHIVWETPIELKEHLTNRIAAVIGDGPLKSVPEEQETPQ